LIDVSEKVDHGAKSTEIFSEQKQWYSIRRTISAPLARLSFTRSRSDQLKEIIDLGS
jgi:hypothetical protein